METKIIEQIITCIVTEQEAPDSSGGGEAEDVAIAEVGHAPARRRIQVRSRAARHRQDRHLRSKIPKLPLTDQTTKIDIKRSQTERLI